MPTPLSASSARIKEVRKLSRRSVRAERRLFLADGPHAVAAAVEHAAALEVFATPAAADQYAALVAAAPLLTLVDERSLAALSGSVTPAGLVAVCRFLDRPLGDILSGATLVAVGAEVRDPGNAGTLVRTADAFGADAVVLAGDSVDAYNAKTVRASAGSLFQVPLAIADDATRAVAAARAAGLTVLATTGRGELSLDEMSPVLVGPVAWLFGNEARGLTAELADLADHRVRIPIPGRAESLNLATAAAVCLHETARVRRTA